MVNLTSTFNHFLCTPVLNTHEPGALYYAWGAMAFGPATSNQGELPVINIKRLNMNTEGARKVTGGGKHAWKIKLKTIHLNSTECLCWIVRVKMYLNFKPCLGHINDC